MIEAVTKVPQVEKEEASVSVTLYMEEETVLIRRDRC
jgi:hypothetical protein